MIGFFLHLASLVFKLGKRIITLNDASNKIPLLNT